MIVLQDIAWSPSPQQDRVNNLKSSGSQTDNLDNNNSQSTTRGHHDADMKKGPHQFISENLIGYQGIVPRGKVHEPKRVTHVYANMAQIKSPEDQVVEQLNSVIHEFTKNANVGIAKPRFKDRGKSENNENGGTWPKCRAPSDTNANPAHPVTSRTNRKERAPLKDMVTLRGPSAFTITRPQSSYIPNTKDSAFLIPPPPSHKPPTPPERGRDSFDSYIKHSPQGSDSTLKYYPAAIPAASKTGNSTFYTGTSAQEADKCDNKMPNEQNRNSSFESSSSNSLQYGGRTPDSVTRELDMSIGSVNEQDHIYSRYVFVSNIIASFSNVTQCS